MSRYVVEDGNDPFDKIRELHQLWDQRLQWNDLRLINRYLDARLLIHVHLAVGFGGKQYCAVLHANRGIVAVDGPDTPTDRGADRVAVPRDVLCEGNSQQQTVLVDHVQFVQTPNGVALPSLVWFQEIDAMHQVIGESLYASVSGRWVFLGILRNGKGVLPTPSDNRPESLGHDAKQQMVERGAQVIKDVSGQTHDGIGNLFETQKAMRNLVGLRVTLSDDFVSARIVDELVDPSVQLFDVLYGPFNLDSRIGFPQRCHV